MPITSGDCQQLVKCHEASLNKMCLPKRCRNLDPLDWLLRHRLGFRLARLPGQTQQLGLEGRERGLAAAAVASIRGRSSAPSTAPAAATTPVPVTAWGSAARRRPLPPVRSIRGPTPPLIVAVPRCALDRGLPALIATIMPLVRVAHSLLPHRGVLGVGGRIMMPTVIGSLEVGLSSLR